jgi:hypothetical protein
LAEEGKKEVGLPNIRYSLSCCPGNLWEAFKLGMIMQTMRLTSLKAAQPPYPSYRAKQLKISYNTTNVSNVKKVYIFVDSTLIILSQYNIFITSCKDMIMLI